ncbi:MAG: hypothetical protein HYW49_13785 [Deltaproteobacteria bacterium]|nr:hypothetical protein [Deltaproteobacteria bacterium]
MGTLKTSYCARLGKVFLVAYVAVAFTAATPMSGCAHKHLRSTLRVPAGSSIPLTNAIEPRVLADALAKNLTRVEEFRILREAARELGLRVWLFGGTAAGYAHYVKWDLLRQSGDTRYNESRFDYDFTNIYRSTQDADLVVDGDVADAEKLEALIKEKLSYLQGSKSEWEVRLLRHDRGVKQALLNNPDFLNQHTDSNSTGMIELTDPSQGEPVVRDLRDWGNRANPFFLKDVAEGRLHYYFSPLHETTSRYLAGHNPPIFSVIRYLTKAFQYELALREEDLGRIKAMIAVFDPMRDPKTWSDWARGWINERGNGAKLIKHAVNMEYAWNTLEDLGLRGKLIAMSDPLTQGTMGWWLNKEPLRSKPVGEGTGATIVEIAAEKGIPWEDFVVAHETNDFLAYESLTRDTTGKPNVVISRQHGVGESAVYGDGHYTRIGRFGARGTGLTVRYRVDPRARDGADFIVDGNFIIFRNRNALWVIPESLNIGPVEFFELLAGGKAFDSSDRGILEKFKRRTLVKFKRLSQKEERSIHAIVEAELAKPAPNQELLRVWLSLQLRERPSDHSLDVLAKLVSHPEAVPVFIEALDAVDPKKQQELFSAISVKTDIGTHYRRHILGNMGSTGFTVDKAITQLYGRKTIQRSFVQGREQVKYERADASLVLKELEAAVMSDARLSFVYSSSGQGPWVRGHVRGSLGVTFDSKSRRKFRLRFMELLKENPSSVFHRGPRPYWRYSAVQEEFIKVMHEIDFTDEERARMAAALEKELFSAEVIEQTSGWIHEDPMVILLRLPAAAEHPEWIERILSMDAEAIGKPRWLSDRFKRRVAIALAFNPALRARPEAAEWVRRLIWHSESLFKGEPGKLDLDLFLRGSFAGLIYDALLRYFVASLGEGDSELLAEYAGVVQEASLRYPEFILTVFHERILTKPYFLTHPKELERVLSAAPALRKIHDNSVANEGGGRRFIRRCARLLWRG